MEEKSQRMNRRRQDKMMNGMNGMKDMDWKLEDMRRMRMNMRMMRMDMRRMRMNMRKKRTDIYWMKLYHCPLYHEYNSYQT